MDKLTEKDTQKIKKNHQKAKSFSKISDFFSKARMLGTDDTSALPRDLLLFAIGFLFSRTHLFFGAKPVALAFVAILPIGIWPALTGCALGALSMGMEGIVYAAAAIIVVFLRAAISCTDKTSDGIPILFCEALLLRMSAALIGGFLTALYHVLMVGLSEKSLLLGISMIFTPPIIAFALSGLFDAGIDVQALLHGEKDVLSLSGKRDKEKYNVIFFQLSAVILIFLLSLSFKSVHIMGISLSYVFSGVATLLVAKRFGAIRAFSIGFISSLGISPTYSIAFALAGLGAGFTFGLGTGYAVIIGGAALCAWSTYTESMTGLLSVLPEYLISSVIAAPILKKISEIKYDIEDKDLGNSSEDMVGTMALSYQNRFSGSLDALEIALSSLAQVIKGFTHTPSTLSEEECKDIINEQSVNTCKECTDSSFCSHAAITPYFDNIDKTASKLASGEQISPEDVNADRKFCRLNTVIADRINRAVARKRQERLSAGGYDGAEEYRLISNLVSNARFKDDGERSVDDSLTNALNEMFTDYGFADGTIRAFGDRRKHFILAGEDEDGSKITSPELQKRIERIANVRLDRPEYFRSGKMVLMECGVRRTLSVHFASADIPGNESEVSGDTVSAFESSDDYFYSLISDGMGRGKEAKTTSEFVCKFMRCALEIGSASDTLLHILNHSIRSRKEECSATVDLFELDLITGDATFIKSGAASSFIKRDSSIFRIKSQTAPIGLLRTIDSEKIRVEIKPGDYIIMLSDGVADAGDDAPWLLLMLGEPVVKNPKDYARSILTEARKNAKAADDMSVIVIKVDQI